MTLPQALQELCDCATDFKNAGYNGAQAGMRRFVACLDKDPLHSLLEAVIPDVNFDAWLERTEASRGVMAGSGTCDWPDDRGERVAMQVALCRSIAEGRVRSDEFARDFYPTLSNRYDDHVADFGHRILDPITRDIGRLIELRVPPPILAEALALPLQPSGDPRLDELLEDAKTKFRDKDPAVRREGLERLWDAWERLKTLEEGHDKGESAAHLIGKAAAQPRFLKLLEDEARALNEVGNKFQIRHFEKDRDPVERDSHVDYLFHRLFALISLLQRSR